MIDKLGQLRDGTDFESPCRMPPADLDAPYEDPREYETVSVFEDFAAEPGVHA